MKKAVVKLIAFVCVFVVSLVVISFYMNKGNTDMTADMGHAALPTIAMRCQGAEVNLMRGFCTEMDPAGMRESITTVGETRQMDIVIHAHGQEIDGAAYELRSMDGGRLIENTRIAELVRSGEDIRASFRLKDLIDEGQEYSLIFVLALKDGREARYYTRVIQAEYYLTEKIDFIREFSDATLDYELLKEYARYLEPNASGNNSTLAKVNIHSSARQVAWGGLMVARETQPEIQVKEIAPQTVSVILSYLVSYMQNEQKVYAWVEEYYRTRYTPERTYLLDYERTAGQLLERSAWSFFNDKINIGIADPDIEMAESDGGTVFAFSHGGTLYSYSVSDSKLTVLFSFLDEEQGDDERTRNTNHDFKILQVEETGNVTFLVHGYMNRGRHEGTCGVQICYYSSTLNVVEELAFIPYTKSAEILKADMENLSYVNGKNDLYLMMNGSIFHIGLEDKRVDVIVQGLYEDSYCVADDRSMAAWLERGQEFYGETLVLMDLNSGRTDRIEAGVGNLIRPLGFMGEDLIYGIVSIGDIHLDAVGYRVFPMYRLVIRNFEGEVLKNYRRTDIYVTSCEIDGNQINLERIRRTEDGFENAVSDQILYSDEIPSSKNYVDTAVTENLQTVVQIALKNQVDNKKVKILTPREVLFEGNRDIYLPQEEHPARYYVYGKTGIVDVLTSPTAAVRLAHESAGAVTAEDGAYIFKRDRLHAVNQIMAITGEQAEEGGSLAVCLDAILRFEGLMRDSGHLLSAGMDVMDILGENLAGRKILNLQGAALDMVLYYPDREVPVLAMLRDGSAVLITGFNEQNVVIMDPSTGEVEKMGMNDARNWFEENGNQFITYW